MKHKSKNKSKRFTRKRKISRYNKRSSSKLTRKRKKKSRGGGKTCRHANIYIRNKILDSKSWIEASDKRLQKDILCKYRTKYFDKFLSDKICDKT